MEIENIDNEDQDCLKSIKLVIQKIENLEKKQCKKQEFKLLLINFGKIKKNFYNKYYY